MVGDLSNYTVSGDCHEHNAATNDSGYCVAKVDGKFWYMHRLSWVNANGDIPEGYEVDHTCFNRKCMNLKHLRLLSRRENARNHQKSQLKENCIYGHKKEMTAWGRNICRICSRNSSKKYKAKCAAMAKLV